MTENTELYGQVAVLKHTAKLTLCHLLLLALQMMELLFRPTSCLN